MDIWEIILILILTLFLILIYTAYLGVFIYFIVPWFVANKKPKGDKLKKARERSLNQKNDRKIKEYIKRVKEAYKNGDTYETIGRFDSYSSYDEDYIHSAVFKWLDNNNIKYRKVTGVYDIDIYFEKEDENNA